jgi:hypothetical protein
MSLDSVESTARDYAINLVHTICCLAGNPSCLDDLRADLRHNGVVDAINRDDTPRLFNWLMSALSYQGIADRVAEGFIEQHGNVQWSDIEQELSLSPSCRKLAGYWAFHGCRYHKWSATCAEPERIASCPLPRHHLRNGRLNQTAYSLFLFFRDVADGDVVRWIDDQLAAVNEPGSPTNVPASRDALIAPLRNVYGGLGQGLGDGPIHAAPRGGEAPGPLVRSRCKLYCGRHLGSQLSAPDRHPAAVQR